MKGIDFSWARPGGASIKAAGFEFVMRYVPYVGDGGKGLTADEVADYRANGLGIGLVFESTAGRMFDGYPAGVTDANQCVSSGDVLGFPASLPFYFACDVDITNADMLALVDDYLAGAATVLGVSRTGIYGEFELMWHCRNAGTAAYFWQTYAWSGGQVFGGNHVYQYLNGQTLNGGAVDYCEGTGEGLWGMEDDMDPRIDELWRRTGGDKGVDFDVLKLIDNQNTATMATLRALITNLRQLASELEVIAS